MLPKDSEKSEIVPALTGVFAGTVELLWLASFAATTTMSGSLPVFCTVHACPLMQPVLLLLAFAEALKGGVSNLSFGDLSAQLGTTM